MPVAVKSLHADYLTIVGHKVCQRKTCSTRARPAQRFRSLAFLCVPVPVHVHVLLHLCRLFLCLVFGLQFYAPRIGALFVQGLGSADKGQRVAPLYPMLFGGGQVRCHCCHACAAHQLARC